MPIVHGIKVVEPVIGARALQLVATAVIGIVATAPDATPDVKAHRDIGVVANNNAVTITSKLPGTEGNAIAIRLVNPGANNAALAVVVAGTTITVNLATGAGGALSTTGAQLKAAIEASADANALVSVTHTGASTGAGIMTAAGLAKLAGGIDSPFPLDRPVLVTDIRAAIADAGEEGTLRPTLEAIADQVTPVMVVVRVAEGEGEDAGEIADDQDAKVIGTIVDGVGTGIQALLAAEAEVGVRPRILGAPGLDSKDVVLALVSAAQKLRGFVYAGLHNRADAAAAIVAREEFSARELMLIWPNTKNGGAVFNGDAVARALGLRALIDEKVGWHKTLSNVAIGGVTGLTKDVLFDLQDMTTTAGVLNDADVTTIVRFNGYRFWGNRTCADDPIWAFESRVRTSQALQDTIAEGLAWAIDKPLTPQLARDVIETINALFRRLKAEGRIIGGQVLPLDTSVNTAAYLAAGQLAIDYEFTDAAPLEGLTLNQRVTDRFYATFGDELARL